MLCGLDIRKMRFGGCRTVHTCLSSVMRFELCDVVRGGSIVQTTSAGSLVPSSEGRSVQSRISADVQMNSLSDLNLNQVGIC